MSIAVAATLAASMSLPSCSCDEPGANRFMGDVVAAVDRNTDIPGPVLGLVLVLVRAKLKLRMEARQYDEIAAIQRDFVTVERKYGLGIGGMRYGQGQLCRTVTCAKQTNGRVERGQVHCESGHCLLVPIVCRDVSGIERLGNAHAMAGRQSGHGLADPITVE